MPTKFFFALAFLLALQSLLAAQATTETKWYDARTLTVEGKGWSDTAEFYDRLPARAEKLVRPEVWRLSRNSAGLSVRFVTDADSISVRWRLRSPNLALPNMTAIAVSGVDLYTRDKGVWRWAASARADKPAVNEQKLIANMTREPREYRLYLPLYNGVDSVEIGLPPNASVSGAPAFPAATAKPIVFYGTSIVQGASASRPGMAYPSILGRHLNRPVINLGFSGNGRMESEIAELLVDIDAAAFVIDCLPNLSTSTDVAERTPKLVRILRQKRPLAPIVLVENIQYPDTHLETSKNKSVHKKNAALKKVYRDLTAAGLKNLTYIPADNLIGPDTEATIDGIHPTDLGFTRMTKVLEPILKKILSK
jgi:lysophospholipase L1-like esterase